MLATGGYFYLIGGQNYSVAYSSGRNNLHTSAIRKFTLKRSNQGWAIADTSSVVDTANLHRRDMNVMPTNSANGLGAIIYGGVFTKRDEAYLNPLEISGLATGSPGLLTDSTNQLTNEYTSAKAVFWFSPADPMFTTFFGGITYEEYNAGTKQLVVSDNGITHAVLQSHFGNVQI